MNDVPARIAGFASALIGIVLCAPLLVICTVLVASSSMGPILFRQRRVGLNGREFVIYKFRTMRVDSTGDAPAITVTGDPRITCVGSFLRRYKLDELPQLFNVIKGDMTLVGPRPEVPQYVKLYSSAQRDVILSVRPGLTDLASLVFIAESQLLALVDDPERHYTDVVMPAKLQLAEQYVRDRSWWLDARIVCATLTGMLGWRWIPAPWSNRLLDG